MVHDPCSLVGAVPQSVRVRSVWNHNVDQEFAMIREAVQWHRIAAMDTEFPGVLHRPQCHPSQMTPDQHYALIKANVDALKPIQVGLTLSDMCGNLPEVDGEPGVGYLWEFNLRGFDHRRDLHAAEKVELLRRQGMNFDALEKEGIDPRRLVQLMLSSGLLMNGSTVTWVTFHCAYDFAFLVKILTETALPESREDLMRLVSWYFGIWLYDVKCMMRHYKGLYGGLEKVARVLNVDRAVGKCHQAGSGSLLTLRTFRKILENSYFTAGLPPPCTMINAADPAPTGTINAAAAAAADTIGISWIDSSYQDPYEVLEPDIFPWPEPSRGPLTMDISDTVHVEPPATLDGSAALDWNHVGCNLQDAQPLDAVVPRNHPGRSWSEEEHRSFLRGLQKFGKGRWTAISKKAVFTKTPAQVASHAQKFFLRQETKRKKQSRRKSIHDITMY